MSLAVDITEARADANDWQAWKQYDARYLLGCGCPVCTYDVAVYLDGLCAWEPMGCRLKRPHSHPSQLTGRRRREAHEAR